MKNSYKGFWVCVCVCVRGETRIFTHVAAVVIVVFSFNECRVSYLWYFWEFLWWIFFHIYCLRARKCVCVSAMCAHMCDSAFTHSRQNWQSAFISLSINLRCIIMIKVWRNSGTKTTSNSSDNFRSSQLVSRCTSIKTIINQWAAIMAKPDYIVVISDNWICLVRDKHQDVTAGLEYCGARLSGKQRVTVVVREMLRALKYSFKCSRNIGYI